jgi:hypothetical protein
MHTHACIVSNSMCANDEEVSSTLLEQFANCFVPNHAKRQTIGTMSESDDPCICPPCRIHSVPLGPTTAYPLAPTRAHYVLVAARGYRTPGSSRHLLQEGDSRSVGRSVRLSQSVGWCDARTPCRHGDTRLHCAAWCIHAWHVDAARRCGSPSGTPVTRWRCLRRSHCRWCGAAHVGGWTMWCLRADSLSLTYHLDVCRSPTAVRFDSLRSRAAPHRNAHAVSVPSSDTHRRTHAAAQYVYRPWTHDWARHAVWEQSACGRRRHNTALECGHLRDRSTHRRTGENASCGSRWGGMAMGLGRRTVI